MKKERNKKKHKNNNALRFGTHTPHHTTPIIFGLHALVVAEGEQAGQKCEPAVVSHETPFVKNYQNRLAS
ncbi:MAG: hypothetical protein ACI9JN_001924 [Bacteroidia bacterium]